MSRSEGDEGHRVFPPKRNDQEHRVVAGLIRAHAADDEPPRGDHDAKREYGVHDRAENVAAALRQTRGKEVNDHVRRPHLAIRK